MRAFRLADTKLYWVDALGEFAFVTLKIEPEEFESLRSKILSEVDQLWPSPSAEGRAPLGVYAVLRSKSGPAKAMGLIAGRAAPGPVAVSEGPLRFEIRFEDEGKPLLHPGLFTDMAPFRAWLLQNAKGLRVLNTFCYTGALSVAAAVGGAREVTQIDLSKKTLQWANQNASFNGVAINSIAGDVMERLPRLARQRVHRFDLVIMDPPSFARTKSGIFKVENDLEKLVEMGAALLEPNGQLAISINTSSFPRQAFERRMRDELRRLKYSIATETQIRSCLPNPDDALKGLIIKLGKAGSNWLK